MVSPPNEAVELVICGQAAAVDTWRGAYLRAKREKVRVYHVEDQWYASSISRPGQRHCVNHTCDCEAAARGLLCKHVAAVRAAQLRVGELARCEHCGCVGTHGTLADESAEVVTMRVRVTDLADKTQTVCRDLVGCWRRWDEQHGLAEEKQ